MKKGLTEMVFILDRSGSMGGLESDTIGGFNATIEKQKKVEGEGIVTTVLFDDKYEVLHDRFDLKHVKKMTEEEYYVRGCTALLDAMGSSIQKQINVQKNLPESEQAENVIFVVITDGYENASCEYSYKDVKKMVESCKEKNWEFLFLGANIDAISEAEKFGIAHDRAVEYMCDDKGIDACYEGLGEFVSERRVCCESVRPSGGWKKKIEDDVKRRKK